MLALSRKPGEEIVIPELGITIRIAGVYGNRVQVGIEAPRHLKIIRGELLDDSPRPRPRPRPPKLAPTQDGNSSEPDSSAPESSFYQSAPVIAAPRPAPIVRMARPQPIPNSTKRGEQ